MRLTQEIVFAACNSLLEKSGRITQAALRREIGGGSYTTIFKYFKKWQAQQNLAIRPELTQNQMPENSFGNSQLLSLQDELEGKVAENFELKQQNLTFSTENQRLTKQNVKFEARIETLEKTYQQLLESYRQLEENGAKREQARQVEFSQMLQEINLATQDKVHDISIKAQDAFLQEKIKTKQAQTQVSGLQSQIEQLKAELAKAQKVVDPLKRKISYQDKLIKKYVGFDELKAGVD